MVHWLMPRQLDVFLTIGTSGRDPNIHLGLDTELCLLAPAASSRCKEQCTVTLGLTTVFESFCKDQIECLTKPADGKSFLCLGDTQCVGFFVCSAASNEGAGMVVTYCMRMTTAFHLLQVDRVQSTGGNFISALHPLQDGHQEIPLSTPLFQSALISEMISSQRALDLLSVSA